MDYLTAAADAFDRPWEPHMFDDDPHGVEAFRDAMELMGHAHRHDRPDLADLLDPHLAHPAWLVEHMPQIAAQLPPHDYRYRTIPQPKGTRP